MGGMPYRLFLSPIQYAARLDQKCPRPLMARIVVRAFMPNGELRKSRDIDRRFEQDESVYAGNQAPRHDGNQVGRQQDFG
jgi:hypothetical protein